MEPPEFSGCQGDGSGEGFPGGSVVKNPPANAGDMGLIPGSGRSPGEGNGYPCQYFCLENPMDRGVLGSCSPWGVPKESDTTEQLNNSNERVLELLALLISRGLLVVTDLSDLL